MAICRVHRNGLDYKLIVFNWTVSKLFLRKMSLEAV